MNLKEIKSLAEQDRFDEALAECERLLRDNPEGKADTLPTRAYIFALKGDYESALRDRESIFNLGEGQMRDYFLAGYNALSAGSFSQASVWLNELLRLSEQQNDTWFRSGTYFLLAYAHMQLGDYTEADEKLNAAIAVESDCAMPLPDLGMCDEKRLREEIKRRQSSSR